MIDFLLIIFLERISVKDMIITKKSNPEITRRYHENYYEYTLFSQQENERLEAVNQNFVFMQNYLKDRMVYIANVFQKLAKKDFPYLKDFRIIGTISAFKPDPRWYTSFSGNLTSEQIQMYDKWKQFRFTDVWYLDYDSSINDFTPLSKILLKSDNFDHWRKTSFSICSYLSFLINQNENITYKDLLDFDFDTDHFCSDIRVYINYTSEEIYSYSNAQQLQFEYKILSERSHVLNNNFEWTKDNIQRFYILNEFCKNQYSYLKSELIKLKNKFTQLCENRIFQDFRIWTNLHYNPKRSFDIPDKDGLKMIERQLTNVQELQLEADLLNPIRDYPADDISLNWNFETYSKFLTRKERDYRFNVYMLRILIDNDIFSFEDIIRMEPEDFCNQWIFSFYEEYPFFSQGGN